MLKLTALSCTFLSVVLCATSGLAESPSDAADAGLVMPKDRSQEVRRIVDALAERRRGDLL